MFLINRGEIEGRLDVFYYDVYFRILVRKLENCGYDFLPLRKLSTITDGSHFSPVNNLSFNKKYITVRDLDYFGEINFNNSLTISEEEFNNLVKSGCQPKINDILFSKDGTIGKTYTVTGFNDFVVLSSLAIISPDINIIKPKYLELILKTDFTLKLVKRLMGGSALQRIVLLNLKSLRIPVPPLEIQDEIIAIFEQAYNAKKQNEAKSSALLASIDGYLLQELGITLPSASEKKTFFITRSNKVSGNRLDPFYHHIEFEELEKSLQSCKYEIQHFSKLITYISSGATPLKSNSESYYTDDSKNGIPLLRVQNITAEGLKLDDVIFINTETHEKDLKRSQVFSGDLLITITGRIASSAVAPKSFEGNINQHSVIVRALLHKSAK